MKIKADDAVSGIAFIGVGLFFSVYAVIGLGIGTAGDMGPGYFPLALGGILVVLGILVGLRGLRDSPAAFGSIPWRPLIFLAAAPMVFGMTVRGLGLLSGTFLATALAALARRETSLVQALITAAAIAAIVVGTFSFGLGVPQPVVGPWMMARG